MKIPTSNDDKFVFSDLFDLDSVENLNPTMRCMTINRKEELSPYIPKIDPDYMFEYSEGFRKLFFYLATGAGLPPWVFGPQGCGKTSGIYQLAGWFHVPVRQIYASSTMESDDLLFGYMPDNTDGVLRLRHRALSNAMKYGWWFIINEFDLLDPVQQKALNQIIEERVAELPSGERVVAHKNFRLIVTANTNGTGDFTGNNCNVGQSDSSVSARFFFVENDYLSAEKEKKILYPAAIKALALYGVTESTTDKEVWKQMCGSINNQIIPTIVSFANEIRDSYKGALAGGKGFPFTLGQRTTLEWVSQSVVDLLWETDSSNALHNAISNGLKFSFINGVRPDFQDEVRNLFNDLVGDSLKVAA